MRGTRAVLSTWLTFAPRITAFRSPKLHARLLRSFFLAGSGIGRLAPRKILRAKCVKRLENVRSYCSNVERFSIPPRLALTYSTSHRLYLTRADPLTKSTPVNYQQFCLCPYFGRYTRILTTRLRISMQIRIFTK